jgi:hypothetical protein
VEISWEGRVTAGAGGRIRVGSCGGGGAAFPFAFPGKPLPPLTETSRRRIVLCGAARQDHATQPGRPPAAASLRTARQAGRLLRLRFPWTQTFYKTLVVANLDPIRAGFLSFFN